MEKNYNILAIESLIILIYKFDIHMMLGNDEDDDMSCYNSMMYLMDRPPKIYYSPYDFRAGTREPDMCGSCYTYFGHTYAGRLRNSCHICQVEELGSRRYIAFNRFCGIPIWRGQYLLVAKTLYKYLLGEDIS